MRKITDELVSASSMRSRKESFGMSKKNYIYIRKKRMSLF